MADQDERDTRIIGRDADAAKDAAPTDPRSQTRSESAGGNVSGTGEDDGSPDFDIVFEPEEAGDSQH